MQFRVGDLVVHPAYGIGQIDKIEEKQLSEKRSHLYYKIVLPEREIWIPVKAQEASGLRRVTAKDDLDQYRDLLKNVPVSLNINYRQRHLELASRLRQGSFQVLCEVVRDLTAWGWQKPLSSMDTATLQKTRQSLYKEWAMAAGISTTEAIKEIDSLLLALNKQMEDNMTMLT